MQAQQDTRLAPEHSNPSRLWFVLAGLVFLVGSGAAYLGAVANAHADGAAAAHAFKNSSSQVALSIQQALVREEDLVDSANAYVADNPTTTNRQFVQWANSEQMIARYPEVVTFGYLVMVPRAALAATEARIAADPPTPGAAVSGSKIVILPPGVRPYYCLALAGIQRPNAGIPPLPLGLDYCEGVLGQAALTARDTGVTAYLPFDLGGKEYLIVGQAIYRDGGVPTSVAARQAGFLGWLGVVMDPSVPLNEGLTGHPGLGVSFSYGAATSAATFTAGPISKRDASLTAVLTSGWTIRTYAHLPPTAVIDHGVALALLIGGVALSACFALLLLVLSTSRYRALRLVQKKTAEIRHQALHDGLTGLPNRVLVADRAEQLLLRTRRNGTEATALYLDLDGFKTINDTLGHEVGDALLVAVADRLRSTVRGVDTIGRLGGDEFVILLDGTPGANDPESIANRVLEAIRSPFQLDGTPNQVVTTISIGIATGDRSAAKDLIRDADVALYQAKDDGRDGFAVYQADMDSALHRRSQLEYDLRTALDDDQFMLLYQPMYDLESLDIIGFEALLRWNHPEFGTVSPGEFIPLLESSGEIVSVGRWVLLQACQQVAHWRDHHPNLFMSVNVSAIQLGRDSIIDHVKEALRTSGLDPSGLTVEITETALMSDIKTATARLYALKNLGVQLAIDDFGSGYSSLAYVQTLPVNSLKIDQSFIRSISSSDEANLIVHSMVELGRKLGLRTVAEGVETVTQLDQVRSEQVDEAQGFLFSRPVHPSVIESWIRAPILAPVSPDGARAKES